MLQHAPRLLEDNPEHRSPFQPLPSGNGLTWSTSAGYGYYEIKHPAAYDQAYFDKYVRYASTDLGRKLTRLRVDLVRKHVRPGLAVVDIGIGCGQFVKAMARSRECSGYDVNPSAIAWLKEKHLWLDPYVGAQRAMTLWDSFEHIQHPMKLLQRCPPVVVMSLPIFRDHAHALRSKHFRPDEHWWYFTSWGLIREMYRAGYQCLAMNDDETRAGREDIQTFVFARLEQENSNHG